MTHQWKHTLEVLLTTPIEDPSEVAEYFLSYLTLDDIDEEGKRPSIPYEAVMVPQSEGLFVMVGWDYDFTFEQMEEMCKTTLPDQLVGLELNDETQAVVEVHYDGKEIKWQPEEDQD